MKSQLYQVFRTYWNRPLILVISLGSLCLTAVLLYQSQNNDSFSITPELKRPGLYKHADSGKWKSFLKNEKLDEIHSLSLHILSPDDNPDLSQLSELESLQIYAPNLTPELLNEIQSLMKLTSLALLVTQTEFEIPEEFFKKLGPQLQELDIIASNRTPFGNIKGVENLENLELLKIAGKDMTLESFKAIKRLPRLKTLVISTSVSLEGEQGKLLLELKNHPTLERTYAHWFRSIEDGPASVRMLALCHASYSQGKVAAIQLGLILMISITLIFCLQLWSQFISPAAIVIPGYAIAHRRAALIILGGGAFITVAGLMLTGIACLPAIVLAFGIPAVIAVVVLTSQSQLLFIRLFGVFLAILVGGFVGGQAIIISSNYFWLSSYYVRFTDGHYWVFTSLLLIAELVAIVVVFRRLPEITRIVNERFSVLPGVSPWDVEKQQRAFLSRGSNWRLNLLFDFRQRDVQYHQGSMWKQIKLWRLGTPFRPLLIFLAMGGVFLILFVSAEISQTAPRYYSSMFTTMFMVEVPFIIAMLATGMWFQRCKKMELETMRPVSRKNIVRQLFLALAFDQSFVIFAGVFFGLFLFYLPDSKLGAEEGYTFILSFIAIVLWIYAISTTIFAIRRTWVIVAVSLGASAILLAVIILLNFDALNKTTGAIDPQSQLAISSIACAITIPVSIAMITYMYRKALQREWG